MRITKWIGILCFLAGGLPSVAFGGVDTSPPKEIGLRIGQHAPGFTLKDQNGKDVSLDSLLKTGPVALVFFRSADWCLSCELELMQVQRNWDQIKATGGQLVGISYDSSKTLHCFADLKKITIPILSDSDSKVIDAYDVRDKNPPATKDGTAAHVTIILDQTGVVRTKIPRLIYNGRSDMDAVVNALKAAQNVKEESKP